METLVPAIAPVRPRVRGDGVDSSRLLEEVVQEQAEEATAGLLWVVGNTGAGKTMALAHLAAVFRDNANIAFLDDGDNLDDAVVCNNFRVLDKKVCVVASRRNSFSSKYPQLILEPWSVDEILEYLLSEHPQQRSNIMQRLGREAHYRWDPEVARMIVDQFLKDPTVVDFADAFSTFVESELRTAGQHSAARQLSLAYQQGGPKSRKVSEKLVLNVSPSVRRILRHPIAQIRLAAEQVVTGLHSWLPARVLEDQLPLAVVEAVGQISHADSKLLEEIDKILQNASRSQCHAMAASIRLAADPHWQPSGQRSGVNFAGGYFAKAQWDGVCLAGLTLQLAEIHEAQLIGANFDKAIAVETDFVEANLQEASFEQSLAVAASFDRADLRHANLCKAKLERAIFADADLRNANLWKANLCGADLTHARFDEANLQETVIVGAKLEQTSFRGCDMRQVDARRVDFRTADLTSANMEKAWLNGANLEGVVWSNAKLREAGLRGALLTGSCLVSADLQKANLSETGLGEVDWENANLQDANLSRVSFQMGSSRSGLVDSPIACEGSRIGFYTDDLEDMYFRKPEEVRKANLRGADLRGADITSVDFYLVDLRDAKLDPFQLEQARRTGAILSE